MKTQELRKLIREEVKNILEQQEQPAYKVGDTVMVSMGPMMAYPHKVIAVINGLDGTLTYNVRPELPFDVKNAYRLGAVGAKADQLKPAK